MFSLLERIPSPNATLLRQLFQILKEIAKNSSFNQMSSHELSIEIAPYILQVPSYHNKVLATAKKVMSHQFYA